METKPTFMPDFFVKPWQLIVDSRITPMTADVFAVVYWYEKMKDGVCTANNATIAKILHRGNSKSIGNAISSLIEFGYVTAEYDPATNERISMSTTVGMSVITPTSENGGGSLKNGGTPHQKMEDNKNNKKRNLLSSEIEKLYHGWLIEFVINPAHGSQVWLTADAERRASLLAAAEKKTRLTDKRKQKLAARLEELGFGTCAKAIRKAAMNPWNHGENPGKWKATIEWLFNSTEKTEEWANR